jgi:hypothetical protein
MSEYVLGNSTKLLSFAKRDVFFPLSLVNLLTNGLKPRLELRNVDLAHPRFRPTCTFVVTVINTNKYTDVTAVSDIFTDHEL